MKVESIVGKDALLSFDEYTIGYVVRYIFTPLTNINRNMSARDNPLLRAICQTASGLPSNLQHADCILSSGEPISFIGARPFNTIIDTGYANGHIFEYKTMSRMLNEFVDVNSAEEATVLSKVLIIQVPQKDLGKLQKFHSYWERARSAKKSKRWERFTNNCSTFAHNAFIEAELLPPKDDDTYDTPDKVYDRLGRLLPKDYQLSRYNGYLGFAERPKYPNEYYLLVKGDTAPEMRSLLKKQ